MNDASTADTKTVSTPYTTFLQGLGREPSADECWRWAAKHVGTAEEPRALSDAGWYTARDGRYEAALILFRRVVEFGGEFARDALVGIVDQLYALDRKSDADRAQHALRAELDTQPAGFTDLRVFDDMVEVLCEHKQHELALAWCQAGLDRIAETNDTPDRETDEYRHGLLIDRGFLRGELGIPLDEDDLAAEAEANAALMAFRALVHDKWDDPFHGQDGETYDGIIILRWAREDFTAVRERWPESTVHYGDDYATYSARIQCEARGYDESGVAHVHMVTATLADFEAYAQRTGQDPADHKTRQHYGQWHHTTHPDQTLTWPPARNGPCWCDSGHKYKKCCGTPANN